MAGMANILEGKKILVIGLRNKWSIAWGIAKRLYDAGARLAFTYQSEREEAGVRALLASLADDAGNGSSGSGGVSESGGSLVGGSLGGFPGAGVSSGNAGGVPGGARDCAFPIIKSDFLGADSEIDSAFEQIGKIWGGLDGVVHAIANARTEDLQNDFILTSRDGFAHALNASVYTLVYTARKASELMVGGGGGSILTLTYMGSERVFPGYNVMGVAKAALEASVRYLAHSLGPKGIRVNAISSGPIKTLSSKAVKNFSSILTEVDEKAPLKRGVDALEVGGSALYLLSDLSSAVTGEIHYVDCGFNIMG